MKILSRLAAIALIFLAAGASLAQAPGAPGSEGLVSVKSRNVDKVWLLPGADFRSYGKVLILRSEVAFQKNWLRDNSRTTGSRIPRVTETDALKVVEATRAGFDAIWAEAFKATGYEIATAPGEGVLQLAPRVVDLYINAPTAPSAGTVRTYTVEAGEATLQLEVRDSRTGTLLGRVTDRRQTNKSPQARITDAVTNRQEFGQLFATWAVIAAKGLQELKATSPLPEEMKPGQKVQRK